MKKQMVVVALALAGAVWLKGILAQEAAKPAEGAEVAAAEAAPAEGAEAAAEAVEGEAKGEGKGEGEDGGEITQERGARKR